MQTTCPQCSQAILIDDAKIPERAFNIRCPRCKATVKFPGKGGAGETPSPTSEASPAASAASPQREGAAPAPAAPPPASEAEQPGHRGRALVALANGTQAGAVTAVLTHIGFAVDLANDDDDAMRRVEQGVFACLVTARTIAPSGQPPTFFQRVGRLSADSRRRLFVGAVGDDYRTGDGMQAFSLAVDLVLHPSDLSSCHGVVRDTLSERQRLYQVFLDARDRLETQ